MPCTSSSTRSKESMHKLHGAMWHNRGRALVQTRTPTCKCYVGELCVAPTSVMNHIIHPIYNLKQRSTCTNQHTRYLAKGEMFPSTCTPTDVECVCVRVARACTCEETHGTVRWTTCTAVWCAAKHIHLARASCTTNAIPPVGDPSAALCDSGMDEHMCEGGDGAAAPIVSTDTARERIRRFPYFLPM